MISILATASPPPIWYPATTNRRGILESRSKEPPFEMKSVETGISMQNRIAKNQTRAAGFTRTEMLVIIEYWRF